MFPAYRLAHASLLPIPGRVSRSFIFDPTCFLNTSYVDKSIFSFLYISSNILWFAARDTFVPFTELKKMNTRARSIRQLRIVVSRVR